MNEAEVFVLADRALAAMLPACGDEVGITVFSSGVRSLWSRLGCLACSMNVREGLERL